MKTHSFKVEAYFEHTLIHILESKYLEKKNMQTILECHPLFEHLYNMLNWENNIESSEVRNTILDYSTQKQIDSEQVKSTQEFSLHYNLDMGIVIRYSGNNCTGEYREIQNTFKVFK